MINFGESNIIPEHPKDLKEKNRNIEKRALKIAEEVSEHFSDYQISYEGMQSGFEVVSDIYLFNASRKQTIKNKVSFSVLKLNIQSVEKVFIEKMKAFGEDVVESV